MQSQRGTEIKVGLFVLVSLFLGGIMIFLIGSANQMFDKQVELYTAFEGVSGLQVGSQVQLSGLKIGIVDQIRIGSLDELSVDKELSKDKLAQLRKAEFPLPPGTPSGGANAAKSERVKSMILVRMKVNNSLLHHVRRGIREVAKDGSLLWKGNSVATIKSKGLLGDSLVEISIGTMGDIIKPSGYVIGETPKSISEFMAEGGEVISSLKRSLFSVETILSQYKDPQLSNDIKGIINSTEQIFSQVKSGPGLLHDLIYSRQLIQNLQGAIAQIRRMTVNLASMTQQLDLTLRRARQPGTLIHNLVISRKSGEIADQAQKLLKNTDIAARRLGQILEAPQRKGTLLHTILYSKETAQLATNLVRSSDRLRSIMDDMRAGKGTLGAIINDPTAFEDFKSILGQVKRSRVFRAMIRFIIKRDDAQKGGKILKD
jgi:phospholipid/cholesterol/gamma-HCH transport system substrate-binding protein